MDAPAKKGLLAMLADRDVPPYVQFLKYAMAGGLATAVDVTVFYFAAILLLPALTPSDPVAVLLGIHPPPLTEAVRSSHYVWSKVFSFFFSNFAAYAANVLWVFTPGRHTRTVEFLLFLLVSATSFCVGTALGWLLIHLTGLPTTYAYIANGVAALAINFVCRKFIVFKG